MTPETEVDRGAAPISEPVPTIPVWDSKRPRKITSVEWDPFQSLNSPYTIRRGLEVGSAAFGALSLSHVFSALGAFFAGVRVDPVIGDTAGQVGRLNLLIAVICALLYRVSWKSRSYVLAYLALAWSLAEFARKQTYDLYGHGALTYVATMGLLAAIVGVRATHASYRWAQSGHE
jgi:hypothetical protein